MDFFKITNQPIKLSQLFDNSCILLITIYLINFVLLIPPKSFPFLPTILIQNFKGAKALTFNCKIYLKLIICFTLKLEIRLLIKSHRIKIKFSAFSTYYYSENNQKVLNLNSPQQIVNYTEMLNTEVDSNY